MRYEVFDLGITDFSDAWSLQKELFAKVNNGSLESALVITHHNPAITLGRGGSGKNILVPLNELERRNIRVYEIERGGDVTYHGPGQLNAYPIFNLQYLKKDIHLFLRQLEKVAIALLSEFGIYGLRRPGLTGTWIGTQKIASIGIAIKNWITFHGLSINIKRDDLENFKLIRPCGMDIEVTSLETVLARSLDIDQVKHVLIRKFSSTFNVEAIPVSAEDAVGC